MNYLSLFSVVNASTQLPAGKNMADPVPDRLFHLVFRSVPVHHFHGLLVFEPFIGFIPVSEYSDKAGFSFRPRGGTDRFPSS
jgi:hypothetical protein